MRARTGVIGEWGQGQRLGSGAQWGLPDADTGTHRLLRRRPQTAGYPVQAPVLGRRHHRPCAAAQGSADLLTYWGNRIGSLAACCWPDWKRFREPHLRPSS